jgi:hypothetical protein
MTIRYLKDIPEGVGDLVGSPAPKELNIQYQDIPSIKTQYLDGTAGGPLAGDLVPATYFPYQELQAR